MKELKTQTKQKIKETIGCLIYAIITLMVIFLIQEMGFFDGLGSEPTPVDNPGDAYLHGNAF